MGDIEYINEFIEKHFKSIRQENKDKIKYILINIYKKDFRIILVMDEIELRIKDGGLLIPSGLFYILEDEFPLLFFSTMEKMQVEINIKKAEEKYIKVESEIEKNKKMQVISNNIYGKKYEELLEEQQEIVKRCYV